MSVGVRVDRRAAGRWSVLAVVAGLVVSLVAGPAAAYGSGIAPLTASGDAPRQGLGYRVGGGDYVGFYLVGHTKIYCLSPRAGLPAEVTLTPRARYRGVSRVASRELAYALARWGNAHTAYRAAAESQLLNLIVGNRADVRRRAAAIPASIRGVLHRRLQLVRRFHGPYDVDVHPGRALLPGQTGAARVVVRAASGARVPQVRVEVRSSPNTRVPDSVSTGRYGVGRFRYTAIGVGETRLHVRAVGLPTTWIEANRPGPGRQHMVARVPMGSAAARVSLGRRAGGFAHGYACSTTCDGRPRTTLRACAPVSRLARRIAFRIVGRDGAVRRVRLGFAPSAHRVCRSFSLRTADGDTVSAAWQWQYRGRWSHGVRAGGGFVVDCPAVPRVVVSMSYDCTRATVRIGLAGAAGPGGAWRPLVNRTGHRLELMITGAVRRRIVAGSGQSATFTATARCGSPRRYAVQAGVERSSGGWNLGPIATVITPTSASGAA